MNDAEVIHRVLAGEHEAFKGLVERHHASVFALCLAHLRNRTEAEDATQEAFLRSYERLNTLRKAASFPGWLATIARNICATRLQSNAREHALLADYARIEKPLANHTHAERLEMAEVLRTMIDRLPTKTREALYLYYIEQKSLKEIGAYLDKSPNAVARLLKYGRGILKERLWEETAGSLKALRPKRDRVVAAMAAIPFGNAPWCTGTTLAASGATTTTTMATALGGGLLMSTKSLVTGLVVMAAFVAALILWQPWAQHSEPRPQTQNASLPPKQDAPSPLPETTRPAKPETNTDTTQKNGSEAALHDEAVTPAPPSGETLRTASISGYVSDDEARPIQGALITVEIAADREGVNIDKTYTARSGPGGLYTVPDIDVFGSAFLFASAQGYVMARTWTRELRAGATIENMDMTLSPAEHLVAGRVVSQNHSGIPQARISLRYYAYDEEGLDLTAATGSTTGNITSGKILFADTDNQGRFEIPIPLPGLCDFTVSHNDYGPAFFPKVPTGSTDVVFTLRAHGSLAGRVTHEDGTPAPGVQVNVVGEALPGGLPFTKTRIQTLPLPTCSILTGDDGSYRAERLGEDYVYTVRVIDRPAGNAGDGSSESNWASHITTIAREFIAGGDPKSLGLAQKRGIRVSAGHTTQGVDFVLGDSTVARIHGVVSDTATGKPVHGITVCADLVETETSVDPGSPLGDAALTAEDGSYQIRLPITSPCRFRIRYWYLSENGSPGFPENAEVAQLDLAPGANETLDFSAPAPMLVPVRYVNPDGEPVEGVTAAMRIAGNRGGWGGRLSDAEGLVLWHGIDPALTYQAIAWLDTPNGLETIAESEPFTGQPGETIPEVVVVCVPRGGCEGLLIGADGQPIGPADIGYAARLEDGTLLPLQVATTKPDGTFCLVSALPEGVLPRVAVGRQVGENLYEIAILDNVKITGDAVVNLGRLELKPMTMEEAAAALGAAAPGAAAPGDEALGDEAP